MARELFVRDADELDGSNETYSRSVVGVGQSTLLYVNDLDVAVTIDAQLSHFDDTDLSEAYSANSQSVSSGGRGSDTLDNDVWERIGGTVSFSSAPSSGSLTVFLIEGSS